MKHKNGHTFPLSDNFMHSAQKTHKHANKHTWPKWDSNSQSPSLSGLRLRISSRGQRDRPCCHYHIRI